MKKSDFKNKESLLELLSRTQRHSFVPSGVFSIKLVEDTSPFQDRTQWCLQPHPMQKLLGGKCQVCSSTLKTSLVVPSSPFQFCLPFTLCASTRPGIRLPVKEAEGDHGWKRPSCCLAELPLWRWEDRSPLTKVIRFSGRPPRGATELG